MERNYGDALEPIAVVGMACRFAGEASSVDKLWEMMMNGRHAASDIPEDRFNADAWYHPSPERKGAVCPPGVCLMAYREITSCHRYLQSVGSS